jgi:NADH:ubiquinone oxidoreductase subunit 2 (subunit N)
MVKVMYFDEPAAAFDGGMALGSKAILVISGVVTLFFIVAASPIISSADVAAKVLFP